MTGNSRTPRGASLSIGPRGTYANVGWPSTGLSWRERLDQPPLRATPTRRWASPPAPAAQRDASADWRPWAWLAPALILLMAFVANYADLRESWELGEPGARHFAFTPMAAAK